MASKLDYNNWRPAGREPYLYHPTRPRKIFQGFKDSKTSFAFQQCDFCFDAASFGCKHCNIRYCAHEECKEKHDVEHTVAFLGA